MNACTTTPETETLESIENDLQLEDAVINTELDHQNHELEISLRWSSGFGLPSGVESAIIQNNSGCIVDFKIVNADNKLIDIWVQPR